MTAIEASSLSQVAKPLCMWSAPLLEPPPSYSPAADAVQCWHHVSFGKHDWPLPAVLMTHDDAEARTAVFASALLEGKVLPVFQGKLADWVACFVLLPQKYPFHHSFATRTVARITSKPVFVSPVISVMSACYELLYNSMHV